MSFSLFLPCHSIAERDEPKDVCACRRLQLCSLSEQLRTCVAVTKLTPMYWTLSLLHGSYADIVTRTCFILRATGHAYGWRTWNLNWPIRIQQARKTLLSWRQCKLARIALLAYLLKPFNSLRNIGPQQHSSNALGSVRSSSAVPMSFSKDSIGIKYSRKGTYNSQNHIRL